jgi:hypothetical protein
LCADYKAKFEAIQHDYQTLKFNQPIVQQENQQLLEKLAQAEEKIKEACLKQQQLEQVQRQESAEKEILKAQVEKFTEAASEQQNLRVKHSAELDQVKSAAHIQATQLQARIDQLSKAQDEQVKKSLERDKRLDEAQQA